MDDEQVVAYALPSGSRSADRFLLLRGLAADRSVLHLGCVDERFTQDRLGTGALLHEELGRTAARLVGVDLSAPGIDLLRAALPGEYVVGDVEELDELPIPSDIDLVVAAEIIEHLPSPGRFLQALERYLRSTGAIAVVTTPNAYSWRHAVKAWVTRREHVHPDHLVAFTPYTLASSMRAAGLQVDQVWVECSSASGGLRRSLARAVDRAITRANPLLASGLIYLVSASPA